MARKPQSIDDDILSALGEDTEADDTADDGVDDEAPQSESNEVDLGGDQTSPQGTKEAPAQVKGQQGPSGRGGNKQNPPGRDARGPKDLTLADGTVIKGGNERRLYENGQREKRRADNAEQQLREMQPQLQAYQASNNIGKELGLGPEHLVVGAKLVKAWMDDPVKMIKQLLTTAQQQGHSIEGIGVGTDVNAIKSLIDERLKPITDATRQQTERATALAGAKRTYDTFVSHHPDADLHKDSLALLLEKDENLTLDGAYWQLKHFYQEHNLDFGKTLQQHRAEIAANGGKQQPVRRQPNVPSGRNAGRHTQGTQTDFGADASFDEIIRDSLKEVGVTH